MRSSCLGGFIIDVENGNAGAGSSEQLRRRPSDTARSARNGRDRTVEAELPEDVICSHHWHLTTGHSYHTPVYHCPLQHSRAIDDMQVEQSDKSASDQYSPDARGPLAGVRVLDVSRLVAGNVVSHVLADFGAEVIKVEAPGRGDDLRAWKVHGVSSYWKVYARNKKSITLDFRQKRGRELLLIVTLLFRSASEDQLA